MPDTAPRSFDAYTREFTGAAGLAQLAAGATTFTTKDPERFRMRLTSVPLLHTRVIDMSVTPHRGLWRENTEQAMGGRVAFFQFTLAGNAIGNIDGRTLSRGPGSIQVLRSGVPFHYVTDTALRSVSLWVPEHLLGGPVADALRRMLAFDVQDDASARGATAIIRSLLQHPPTPGSPEAGDLEAVLLAQLETVAISAAGRIGADERSGLYSRIRAHLLAHLTDPEQNPESIAAELGVGAAAIAHALQAHRTTVSQLQRELRFDRLCALLREDGAGRSLAALADAAGYGGADQAGRAFRDRTGVTMSAYRRLARM